MVKIKIKTSYAIAIPTLILISGLAVWLWILSGSSICNCGTASGDCGTYKWLNPRLSCSEKPVINKASYLQFRKGLEGRIETWKKDGKAEDIAVFFRDLENGPTFGVNEKKEFIPASLLKVPMMFSYFKLAEEDPAILKKTLEFKGVPPGPLAHPQTITLEHQLELGRSYAIDELIFRMVAYSDNGAFWILFDNIKKISPGLPAETLTELGIISGTSRDDASLSVKTYASLFRLLYNSSYLSKEYSEKALDILSQSSYDAGLEAGIPENISIAHKFSERWLSDEKIQLHDCGIIYFPGNSYLLCVMTSGGSFESLKEIISNISKSVWEEINSRKL